MTYAPMKGPQYPLLQMAASLDKNERRFYELLLQNPSKRIPADFLGDRMRKKLGQLLKEEGGDVCLNPAVLKETYERSLRNKVRKRPQLAKELFYDAFDRLEHVAESIEVRENILLGICRATEEPLMVQGEFYHVDIFVDDDREDVAVCLVQEK